jgi:hypothetical protein
MDFAADERGWTQIAAKLGKQALQRRLPVG